MNFEPKQKNKAPDILVLCLFLCAAVCVIFSAIRGVLGKGVLQTVALFISCAMIFVMVKYKFTRVRYCIRKKSEKGYGDEEDDGVLRDANGKELPITAYPPEKLELYIETAQGKRNFIGENLIALDEIISVEKLPAEKAAKKSFLTKHKKIPTYKYCKNLVGADVWVVFSQSSKFFLEYDEKFIGYLCAVARYNKEKNKED